MCVPNSPNHPHSRLLIFFFFFLCEWSSTFLPAPRLRWCTSMGTTPCQRILDILPRATQALAASPMILQTLPRIPIPCPAASLFLLFASSLMEVIVKGISGTMPPPRCSMRITAALGRIKCWASRVGFSSPRLLDGYQAPLSMGPKAKQEHSLHQHCSLGQMLKWTCLPCLGHQIARQDKTKKKKLGWGTGLLIAIKCGRCFPKTTVGMILVTKRHT